MPTLDSVEVCQGTVFSERQGEPGVNSANREERGTDHSGPSGVSDSGKRRELDRVESSNTGDTRACGVHLPPDHPCLSYIRG